MEQIIELKSYKTDALIRFASYNFNYQIYFNENWIHFVDSYKIPL